MSTSPLSIFIGTSDSKNSTRGIYHVALDPTTGALTAPQLVMATPNPGFLTWHPTGRFLYASGEVGGLPHTRASGTADAYTIDPATNQLTRISSQPTGGLSVTHLAADATGRMLITVAYHSGHIISLPILADGTLGQPATTILSAGQLGPNRERQNAPHPHSVTIAPDNRHAYVCHLGLDRVFCFRLELDTATLVPAGEFPTVPGSGPRHSKFSADGRFFYVANELDNTVAVFACDTATGALTEQQVLPTLPADFKTLNTPAEIRVHPNGRFVYASNRGHDSLVVWSCDATNGSLTLIERVPCGGRTPRNFALSPDGTWLVCAALDDSSLASFRVDPATGRLTRAGQTTGIAAPTCVLFVGAKS